MIPPITSRRIKNNDAANAITITQPNAMFPAHKSAFVGWRRGTVGGEGFGLLGEEGCD